MMASALRTQAIAALILSLLAITRASGERPRVTSGSSVTSIVVENDEDAGSFGGVAFRHVTGTLRGTVGADEAVAGLSAAYGDGHPITYRAGFDAYVPRGQAHADAIVVEAMNRGAPILTRAAVGDTPSVTGNAYLLGRGISFARVQWQVGIADGIPRSAQGAGEVIVRDFGRLLGGEFPETKAGLPIYAHRVLAGISQSAFFVNAFMAEGFDRDPASGQAVYQGILTRDGNGLAMAINGFARGGSQFPYIAPTVRLTPADLLRKAPKGVVVVDVAAATDFYRLDGGAFSRAAGDAHVHRYATAAPHAPWGVSPAAATIAPTRCEDGAGTRLMPMRDIFVVRALLVDLVAALGAHVDGLKHLPSDAPLDLVPAEPTVKMVRSSHGSWVPHADRDGALLGGVALPDARWPLGVVSPPALSPVGMDAIDEVCGNFAGWRPFSGAELKQRYRSRQAYIARVRAQAGALVSQGFLLADDEPAAILAIVRQLPSDFD